MDVPNGWVLKQDHNRRGLVFDLPKGALVEDILDFMLAASTALSGVLITDRWIADAVVQR